MFSERTDVHWPWIFSFSTAGTLKIRSRSPKSNQFFVMFQLYSHENLLRIQPLVHKILCRQDSVTPTPKPTPTPLGSASKSVCPLPLGDVGCGVVGGGFEIINKNVSLSYFSGFKHNHKKKKSHLLKIEAKPYSPLCIVKTWNGGGVA